MNPVTFRSWPARALLVATSALAVSCSTPESGETEGAEEASIDLADRVALTPDALASLELTYATAALMALTPTLEVPAELIPDADRLAEIGARVSGRIVEVFVNVGDHVGRSDPLLAIESAEVGRAWADLVAARASERVARRARDRQQALLDGRVTSMRAFEEAQGAWEIANAELRAALTRLGSLGVAEPGEPPVNPARLRPAGPRRER